MAFDRKNFERIAGNVNKLFFYKTPDAIATVTAANYFNGQNVENEIDKGDVIMVTTLSTGAPVVETLCIQSARGVSPIVVVAEA